MEGHRFLISGDPLTARNTVYNALSSQGFTLSHVDEWTADAERGSSGASIAFGAFAGKKGRHVKLRVTLQGAPEGFWVTLTQGTSGISGGVIGMNQASTLYADVYNTIGAIFQNAGVLLWGGSI